MSLVPKLEVVSKVEYGLKYSMCIYPMAAISAEETVIVGNGIHLVEPGVWMAIIPMTWKVPPPSFVQVLWSTLSATH